MSVTKPVGATATFTAVVTNAEGVELPDAVVTFTDDSTDAVTPTPDNAHVATLTGTSIETVNVTASVDGANGPITATDSAVFVDNTPAAITLVAS